ncbi:MAG: apolipoprotein N-acyltransferase [Planctomycetes bacterium]|nr:apolipoprotein N-acyltransferase [Planctomycetota bacterium]
MRATGRALASAVLLILAQEPWGWSPLACVALLPLASLGLEQGPPRRRLLPAYAGGLVFFAGGCWWLAATSPVNLVLMALVEALAFPLFVLALRAMRARPGPPLWLALALAWVAVEFTRGRVPFNGFPWLLLGHACNRPLELAQAADLGGVTLLSFCAALVNGLVLEAWRRRARRRAALAWLGAAALLPLALLAYGLPRRAQVAAAETPGPRVAIVQANVPQGLKQTLKSPDELASYQMRTTELALARAGAEPFDLLCWAETMFPALLDAGETEAARQSDEERVAGPLVRPRLAALGVSFLTGATTARRGEGVVEQYNSALLFDAQGRRTGTYHKTVLVPGGEFIPLRWLVKDLVDPVVQGITGGFLPGLTAGAGPRVFALRARDGREFSLAATICYENCYAGYVARTAAAGVDFIVNLSNEAWFRESSEFDQMEAAAVLRAIETRRTLVRVTNSGISAVYDATGKRRAVLLGAGGRDRAVEGVLLAGVPVFGSFSLFARSGDVLGFLVSAAALALILAGAWRHGASRRGARAT